MECTSAGRILIAILMVALLAGYLVLSMAVAFVYINRDPASPSWTAQSHGRTEAAVLVVKFALALIYNVLDDQIVGTIGLSLVLILIGAAFSWAYATY